MSQQPELDANTVISSWLNEYGDGMYSWAYYKTSSKETAEDLVQDTFISAFRSIEKFQPGSNPKTWLYTILNNKIIDHYRASNTNRSVNQTELHSMQGKDDRFDADGMWRTSPISHWAEDETHLLDNEGFLDVLNHCIEALPERWRQVIVGKYIEHKKGKEICQELEITSSNLWQMAHRAKLQLKGCLDQNWKE